MAHVQKKSTKKKRTVLFLILPDIHLLDMAGADQVFYEVKAYGQDVELRYCTTGNGVLTSNRMQIAAQEPYSDFNLGEGDYLFVPGSEVRYFLSPAFARFTALHEWIRRQHASGATVCSICTGAFALARTGLLNGRHCTTHWKRTAELQHLYPEAIVKENVLFTDDGRIMTSAGVSSGIDLALHIVAKEYGDRLAFIIARELVVYLRRSADAVQHSVFMQHRNHVHSGIHAVQDWLIDNIASKPALDDLARVACMSTRTLTRLFKKETGSTIGEYMLTLRKAIIGELMEKPDLTRRQIAEQCGLESERQLLRILKKMD
ncbi:MAG: DJ-1/PfpI family protein [Candidatus Kapabacteria bacterium]|nr:DJ-1/PfpI family protein [Candidatus Kapabacteria bacterium]